MRTAIAAVAAATVLSALAACNRGPAEDAPVEASAVAVADPAVLEADAVDAAAEDTSATELVYTGDDDSAVTAALTEDDSYRIAEGDRTYYYRRGEAQPYLVREQGRTYAFDDGRLEIAVDAEGRALSQAERRSVENNASRLIDRGRQLKTAVEPRLVAPAGAASTSGEDRPTAAAEGQRRTRTDGQTTAPDPATPAREDADRSTPRGNQDRSSGAADVSRGSETAALPRRRPPCCAG